MPKNNHNNIQNKSFIYQNIIKFKVAFKGLKIVFLEESSFRYQFIILLLTISLGFLVGLSKMEWIAIAFATIIVFTFEVMNTAIENIIDLVSPEYNVLAGKIKDISAGAVLLSTIGAVIIGIIIFYPKIINFI
ncbi:diacylglycerol kinase family protein [Erysipelotrichaceae bacterium OttesenSCG-928-M19]|nr:diacylglycerol kinase family protein [Erysipelotrichaceae bacterium OttesenSCG-928-M19]